MLCIEMLLLFLCSCGGLIERGDVVVEVLVEVG